MTHNAKLRGFLGEIDEAVLKISHETDFQEIFKKLREYIGREGRIEFKNGGKWVFAAMSFLAAIIFGYQYFNSYGLPEYLGGWIFAVVALFVAAIIMPICFAFANDSKISDVSDKIFAKDILFDNGLEHVSVCGKEADLYEDFYKRFGDFRSRGDEDWEITRLVTGKCQAEGSELPYQYYKFHYVRVYYVPVVVSNGKTSTVVMQRRTEDLYRYGLILPFALAKNIAVVSGGGAYEYDCSWKTASDGFNKIFDVYADTEQSAAKFLKPAVILAFLEIAGQLSDLNVEINGSGEMNISFSDEIMFDRKRKYSIAEVDEFEAEIRDHRRLANLEKLVELIGILYKHNDSNF